MASSASSSSLKKSTTSSLSAPSATDSTASTEPLYQVKLLSALRSGDPALIHPFLAEIGKEKRRSTTDQRHSVALGVLVPATPNSNSTPNPAATNTGANTTLDTGAAALHLAIRCASRETIALLLSHRAISPNGVHPPGSGTTALHLAAALGRADVVALLLEQEAIDDTMVDGAGRTARDVAVARGGGKEVVRVIDDSRAFLNAAYRSLLRSYILSPLPPSASTTGTSSLSSLPSPFLSSASGQPSPALLALLSSPRAAHINLSYLDDASGSALLHEAARRRDLRLIELAVRAGADVFVRDRRGKMAGQGKEGRDEKVKVFLRQYASLMRAATAGPGAPEPPVLRGYLNKYTNVAKGYNTRWFVLKDGVLSYYRHQEDEQFASRGSIAVRTCVLKASGADRMRFEIHSGHRGGEKWYLKANHPVEASRWVKAVEASIAWAKAREGDAAESEGGGGSILGGSIGGGSIGGGGSAMSSSVSVSGRQRLVSVLKKGPGSIGSVRRSVTAGSEAESLAPSEYTGRESGEHSPKMGGGGESDVDGELGAGVGRGEEADAEDEEEEDDGYDDSSASANSSSIRAKVEAPHEASFELLGNSATAQMELTLGLVGGVGAAHDALKDALGMVGEFVAVARERDAWWRRKLGRAQMKQSAWERSLASAVREGEVLERELRMRSRKRGSRFFDAELALGAVGANGTLKARSKRPSMLATSVLEDEVVDSPVREDAVRPPLATLPAPVEPAATASPAPPAALPAPVLAPAVRSATAETLIALPLTATNSTFAGRSYNNYGDAESVIDTDEEDEFFDAIEANNIPNLVVHESLRSPTHSELALPETINVEPYAGYQTLREQLLLSDARPSTSLWSVLKHSIGKDLTKISFPVFFNEPTSMLQRMAEDMEFSECLDVAAKERDAHRRIAFVAAFAMSNYSSTIGRIAKPFNPMLSETFEYVRIDKEYRYLSEQVSHHPPISACMAESPYWRYFGEVDAQNKFMGKSFEIRPTGVAHTELLIPAEFAPSYPKASGPFDGKVLEHYSWKKVTTNVSGFILGSPTIDHYGDMVITNHRTKDTCVLTFKPRGWRGKDAYEISGRVMDSAGRITYEISGRWNSQLIARQIGAGGGVLNPDLSVSSLNSPSVTPEYILLWRNSDKPEGSPFNLTPFAITLNDCPKETLKPYLCPTDCRLRPDQRAFEMGKYEIANTLKNDQEELQRGTRKLREQGELPPHRPRWFSAETDGDTGERVWTPARLEDGAMEYWAERERVWRVWKMGGNQPWTDVEPIFIEEPDFIR
ncbi:Oxysterol-binding protein-domain-containing protein [Mycena rosella]|uniref:Oxysterol-binding protein-domain-containing protein n=1 Tax=Mycena rosella TaxID=1033263 RepID=A0AAD7GYS2_MYCRO|nr:Oxysterol-binding protein-domain-containing protein [Mycena rosella]